MRLYHLQFISLFYYHVTPVFLWYGYVTRKLHLGRSQVLKQLIEKVKWLHPDKQYRSIAPLKYSVCGESTRQETNQS